MVQVFSIDIAYIQETSKSKIDTGPSLHKKGFTFIFL